MKETLEQYLARGGKVEKCPPATCINAIRCFWPIGSEPVQQPDTARYWLHREYSLRMGYGPGGHTSGNPNWDW